jgi:hypothetical protein
LAASCGLAEKNNNMFPELKILNLKPFKDHNLSLKNVEHPNNQKWQKFYIFKFGHNFIAPGYGSVSPISCRIIFAKNKQIIEIPQLQHRSTDSYL